MVYFLKELFVELDLKIVVRVCQPWFTGIHLSAQKGMLKIKKFQ